MALEKKDFDQIEKIVGGVEKRLEKKIEVSADKTKKELKQEIKGTEGKLEGQIRSSENRIIAVLSREITDLSEINREVINRVDKIAELEKRIIRIEHKIGIT